MKGYELMALFNNKLKQENRDLQAKVDELTMGGQSIPISSHINGVSVNDEKIFQIPTVEACVNLISSSIAPIPVYLYKNDDKGNIERVPDMRERLLNDENQFGMSGIDFKKMMIVDYLLQGQAQAFIRYDESNVLGETYFDLKELNHLPAKHIHTTPTDHDGIKYTDAEYRFTQLNAVSTNRKQRVFKPEELLLVLNTPLNPYEGVGILKRGETTFAQALSEIEYTNGIYNKGTLPLGILKSTARLSQGAVDRLRESWANLYSGVKNSAKTVILEEGMSYLPLSLKPDELQMNETSKRTNSEICKLFGVPESMITTAANKYGSIEQNSLHFHKHTLAPIIASFESAFNRQLLTEEEKEQGYVFRFDATQLLRATQTELSNSLVTLSSGGIMTTNEARFRLDLPPVKDGDELKHSLGDVFQDVKTGEKEVPNMQGKTDQPVKDEVKNE